MRIVATIEARMTSTRLPGNVMLQVLGKPMLHYLVERLKKVPSIDEIILATTVSSDDDILVEFAKDEDIKYFRGSEEDVMLRVVAILAEKEVISSIPTDGRPCVLPHKEIGSIRGYL